MFWLMKSEKIISSTPIKQVDECKYCRSLTIFSPTFQRSIFCGVFLRFFSNILVGDFLVILRLLLVCCFDLFFWDHSKGIFFLGVGCWKFLGVFLMVICFLGGWNSFGASLVVLFFWIFFIPFPVFGTWFLTSFYF